MGSNSDSAVGVVVGRATVGTRSRRRRPWTIEAMLWILLRIEVLSAA